MAVSCVFTKNKWCCCVGREIYSCKLLVRYNQLYFCHPGNEETVPKLDTRHTYSAQTFCIAGHTRTTDAKLDDSLPLLQLSGSFARNCTCEALIALDSIAYLA